jgi:hypothetical protein
MPALSSETKHALKAVRTYLAGENEAHEPSSGFYALTTTNI